MRSRMRRMGMVAVVVALMAMGCDKEPSGRSGPEDLSSMSASLQLFEGCGELEGYLKDVLLSEMEIRYAQYDACLDDSEGCGGRGYPVASPGWGGEVGMDDGAAAPSDQNSGATGDDTDAPKASEDYSKTNTQEQGVDEADIVKTDGTYLYVLDGNALRIVQAAPVGEMGLTSSIAIEGTPTEMFLSGDRIAVFSSTYAYGGYYQGGVPVDAAPAAGDAAASPAYYEEKRPDGTVPEDTTLDPVHQALAEFQGEVLKVTIVDVSDRANPRVERETYAEAGYVSARMIGATVHLVARNYPRVPSFEWYGYWYGGGGRWTEDAPSPTPAFDGGETPSADAGSAPDEPYDAGSGERPAGEDAGSSEYVPSEDAGSAGAPPPDADMMPPEPPESDASGGSDTGWAIDTSVPAEDVSGGTDEPYDARADLEAARRAYVEQVQALTLDDMMPRRLDVVDGQPQVGLLVPCDTFYHPSVSMGLNVLAVLSFDLGGDASVSATGILGSSEIVYGSTDSLYVATYVYDYWMWEFAAEQAPETALERTAIHAFDIAGTPGAAVYEASGFVQGRVLNQFSMSEYEGDLRVATSWRDWVNGTPSESGVFVLRADGAELGVIGQVTGIAPGEEIFAARFFGAKGYVVTFERRDPFFTFDLSDPTNPRKVGELHVPGYSSYIHPLDDTHVLTIGRQMNDNGDWVEDEGVKLAIYDLTDFANPREAFPPFELGMGTYSQAEYDHKAFNFYPELGVLAIPLSSYNWDGTGDMPTNGLALFDVSVDDGISELGFVSHADLVPGAGEAESYCWYLPEVRRSVFIGERVYSISDVGVKANEVAAGMTELGVVAFPDDGQSYGGYGCYGTYPEEPPMEDDGTDEEKPDEREPTPPEGH